MNGIPGFVGEAEHGQEIGEGEFIEGVQSKIDKTLTFQQLTEEEKEKILMKLYDIKFLEVLMKELSVDTSKMLLIIENLSIIFDKECGYVIYLQFNNGDYYYIDMSTYDKVFIAYYQKE